MRYTLIIGLLLVIGLLAAPAAAFSINRLDIQIADNGDARVNADYTLSWVENLAVFMRLVQPARQLENALEQYSGKDVTVSSVSARNAAFSIEDFASEKQVSGGTAFTTPALDFSVMVKAIRNNRLSRFVNVDPSPQITVVSFPDGYQESFTNSVKIPGIRHVVA